MVCRKICWSLGIPLILTVVCGLSPPPGAQAQYQFQIIHSFGGPGDGVSADGLVMDGAGNLYGVSDGGPDDGGTVFELSPSANGQWTEAILHNFPDGDPSDGSGPIGRLAIDEAGNLYGVTVFGGDGQYCYEGDTCGTVYEVSPGANGEWTESILYNFCSLPDCADGIHPLYAPTLGPGGSLYGAAGQIAFQLMPGSNGWTYNLLYTFSCNGECAVTSYLTLDGKGNLYGEENWECCGRVFALEPGQNGLWTEVDILDFSGLNGSQPIGGLTFHGGGLYGVTKFGGSKCANVGGCGTVFELTRGEGNNIVNEQVIWSFGGDGGAQGINPSTWVAFNKQGDLFGVTGLGGDGENGVVYGMRQRPNGTWEYAVLHAFDGADGVDPNAGLLIDSKGNLYGTTGAGGQYGYGVAFELSPVTQAN